MKVYFKKSYIKVALLIAYIFILIFILLKKVIWLFIFALLLLILYTLYSKLNRILERYFIYQILYYPFVVIAIFIMAISVRIFFFEIYYIPTNSMRNTIFAGDIILMNKLVYGPLLPKNPYEVPWFNLFYYFISKNKSSIDSSCWNIKRLKGFSKIKYNDIIIFEHNENNENIIFIKRCTGLPGDTIHIINEKIYTHGKIIDSPPEAIYTYKIYYSDYNKLFNVLKLPDIEKNLIAYNEKENYLSVIMPYMIKEKLLKYNFINSIVIEKERADTAFHKFPYSNLFNWTLDSFGPLWIPARNKEILLNTKNYILYKDIINTETKSNFKIINDSIFIIDNQIVTKYKFKNNYYFVMGDNRHDSRDSRYIGFISEDNILGKATVIIFSKTEKINLNRIFKKLK